MSHELRTPLNAIIGFSELMSSGVFGTLGSAKYDEYCHDIRASGEYLLGFIDDILNMSRIESGKMRLEKETVSVDLAVTEAVRAVADDAEAKSLDVTLERLTGATLHADPHAIHQILLNILRNAVKFTPESGRVAVRLRAVAGAINIYVEDNGVGIPPEALKTLGRPFEKVEGDFRPRPQRVRPGACHRQVAGRNARWRIAHPLQPRRGDDRHDPPAANGENTRRGDRAGQRGRLEYFQAKWIRFSAPDDALLEE